ncbi:HEXXH motif-containing protein [Streptomyces mirabilis]|uniref:HEXXH motif-containing protein n=1 Tax=Streptomyces mirabilis TaxID=68239 RepID=A0A1I2XUE1_9ACTN|nr:HEXXH motif-containing protein [Streptomyces mirabilis]
MPQGQRTDTSGTGPPHSCARWMWRTTHRGARRLGGPPPAPRRQIAPEVEDLQKLVRVRDHLPGSPSETCRRCPVLTSCGGSLYTHRYSPERGFDNPFIFCADPRALIEGIAEQVVNRSLATVVSDSDELSFEHMGLDRLLFQVAPTSADSWTSTRRRGRRDAELDRNAQKAVVLGPGAVAVLDVLRAEQLVQHGPGQHGALTDAAAGDGVLRQVNLHDCTDGNLFHAPWRDNPRPLTGLVHRAYAFAGVATFCAPGGGSTKSLPDSSPTRSWLTCASRPSTGAGAGRRSRRAVSGPAAPPPSPSGREPGSQRTRGSTGSDCRAVRATASRTPRRPPGPAPGPR